MPTKILNWGAEGKAFERIPRWAIFMENNNFRGDWCSMIFLSLRRFVGDVITSDHQFSSITFKFSHIPERLENSLNISRLPNISLTHIIFSEVKIHEKHLKQIFCTKATKSNAAISLSNDIYTYVKSCGGEFFFWYFGFKVNEKDICTMLKEAANKWDNLSRVTSPYHRKLAPFFCSLTNWKSSTLSHLSHAIEN